MWISLWEVTVCVWRGLDLWRHLKCRWQLLLERGLDMVGHLQLDFTAWCASGRQGPLALTPGLRCGASVVSALARPRCADARAKENQR